MTLLQGSQGNRQRGTIGACRWSAETDALHFKGVVCDPQAKAQKPMRQPVRPFITAYKYRSSKSRTSGAWDIEPPEKVELQPAHVGPGAESTRKSAQGESYAAAMAAADALFGGRASDPVAPSAPPAAATGRILPSLLQASEQPTPAAEPPPKAPRAPVKTKPTRATVPKPRKAKAPASDGEPVVAERAAEPAPIRMIESPTTAQRERSAIQGRWVRKTELKPGEKWKRRLCAPAR